MKEKWKVVTFCLLELYPYTAVRWWWEFDIYRIGIVCYCLSVTLKPQHECV